MRPRLRNLNAREIRYLRHWGMEFVVVVAGVLLALFLAGWAEGRREALLHAETVTRMNEAISRTQALGAVRVATSPCLLERLAELDRALQAGSGEWQAMPLVNIPKAMRERSAFPFVYVFDSIAVPTDIFSVAEANGAMASLPSERGALYTDMRQSVVWIDENWRRGEEMRRGLAVLGRPARFDDATRFRLRETLAALNEENATSVARARALRAYMSDAGIGFTAADRALFADRIAFARELHGPCVRTIDMETLEPVGGPAS